MIPVEEKTYDVWFFYLGGSYTKERSHLPTEAAVDFACQATRRPAAKVGILQQVMITDRDDFCVFHWKHGEGIVFPPKKD